MNHDNSDDLPGVNRHAIRFDLSSEQTFESVQLSDRIAVLPVSAAEATRLAIAQAITGLTITMDPGSLAARIRAAIPFGVDLVNTTPEALAEAFHSRAVLQGKLHASRESTRIGSFDVQQVENLTASWRALRWRVIPERPMEPALNVAIDEWLTDRVASGECPATLRFWCWSQPAVIIGRCQSVANEVDRNAAQQMGVQVVRRMTGGGAMFVQPHGAITYSLVLPESAVAGLTIRQSYEVFDSWVILAMRALGIDAHHVPVNDIACSDGKIGGAAQARRKGMVLHHTTIAYDMNEAEMASVLRIGREKLRERAVASAAKRVSPLTRQTSLPRQVIVEALLRHFQSRMAGTVCALTDTELEAAGKLAEEKYKSRQWTDDFE